MDRIESQGIENQIEDNYMLLIECALSGKRFKLPPKKVNKPKVIHEPCACGKESVCRGLCVSCYNGMYRMNHGQVKPWVMKKHE